MSILEGWRIWPTRLLVRSSRERFPCQLVLQPQRAAVPLLLTRERLPAWFLRTRPKIWSGLRVLVQLRCVLPGRPTRLLSLPAPRDGLLANAVSNQEPTLQLRLLKANWKRLVRLRPRPVVPVLCRMVLLRHLLRHSEVQGHSIAVLLPGSLDWLLLVAHPSLLGAHPHVLETRRLPVQAAAMVLLAAEQGRLVQPGFMMLPGWLLLPAMLWLSFLHRVALLLRQI